MLLRFISMAIFAMIEANNWLIENIDNTGTSFLTPDPDFYRNVSELITSKGYPAEDHIVQTEDGFLLSVQHIAHGRNGPSTFQSKRKVVFLQHGFLSASHDWVINFPHQSLGFILADAGYDVWMGNTRGNTYSRQHIKYTPDMNEFWENSTFSEMGYYDVPAMIDYVLNMTGEKQLSYIGHSQGTADCFVMLSERPEYNQKIKIFIALAPISSVGYMKNPIRFIAGSTEKFEFFFKLFKWKEFLSNGALTKIFSELVCNQKEPVVCKLFMTLAFGESSELNSTRIHVYAAHTPAGTSLKSIIHYAQLYLSGKFAKYDYGKKGNLAHYGQETPPEFDLSRITAPVAISWASHDNLADPTDVKLLLKKLKSSVDVYEVPYKPFSHIDFTLAIHAKHLLYDKVLEWLKRFSS
ncbi:gastric triacylglycerol lipase-like [Argiope bruennichi]|uniref:Lipase n=1 Tax=Argiope bruennichi TaxID=94029 RepID=A0A8T0EEE0_ARGBR|nr:gastric triacylglycerol lipase-like [Argiope bruennichi]XP_055952019.1 gastric triacylglycerol lipase-like [Argiope bruennichi]XP_055952020.1 gastric triacylglycerol lipase-like [Argiope bruennichi]KAF8771251.1 Gastric triacylglycerol lipase like protein [Argiope bruennichi]